jgi:hypothetical protein
LKDAVILAIETPLHPVVLLLLILVVVSLSLVHCQSQEEDRNQDRSVDIVKGYGLDSWGSIPSRGKRFFSFPQHAYWLWGTPSLLSNGCQGLVLWG